MAQSVAVLHVSQGNTRLPVQRIEVVEIGNVGHLHYSHVQYGGCRIG